MLSNFGIEAGKRTAIDVRISTNQQKTDRQVVELMDFAERSRIDVKPEDVFIDIINGFKEGETVLSIQSSNRRPRKGLINEYMYLIV